MRISKQNLSQVKPQPGLVIPGENVFALPERVLQFGTGVLLRGLPDYFIDKANREGIFNGRIVMIKSTSQGDASAFSDQDNLYTVCVRGVEKGNTIEETIINSSISRTLSAAGEWNEILACAHNPQMQVIISNTTEVGITYTDDDINAVPPESFPGKLTAFLYERFKAFSGTTESGMVIIPTELIIDNGNKLKEIVLQQAAANGLAEDFIQWLTTANHFCNSLVDRIVPGKLPDQERVITESNLGYKDDLMIMAESFRLWAIESNHPQVKEILSFSKADEGVVITGDIEKFRELKLRLLNGTHTFSCGLAYLAGFNSVKQAMADDSLSLFVQQLAIREIAAALSNDSISYTEACEFAAKVLDRFRNPFLDHQWLSISVQYSSKMKMRNVPLILRHYSKTSQVPEHMALGFAAYILFMKGGHRDHYLSNGDSNGTTYTIQDDHAQYFLEKWQQSDTDKVADEILGDKKFWGTDLSRLNGFAGAVKGYLRSLVRHGAIATIRRLQLNRTIA